LEGLEEELNSLFSIVENNDFPRYIELRIQQENNAIEDLKEQIAIQEQEIIKNPSQEDVINDMIQELRRNITSIEENTIPILQLRLDKNIIPGEDNWQNRAIMDIEMNRQQLAYTEIISEEEFNQQTWLVQQYGSYQNYVDAMQEQIDQMNHAIIIAEKSINADKPDMKFVYSGSRNRTVRFLNYSVFITLFAVLLGGWIMASEFQQGTIRLLMIRPKTRTKILAAKFLSALIICMVIYVTGSLLNMVTNGICFGFSDYTFPNYTLAGEIGFLGYYLPKMLACCVPIIFAYAIAFMLSVLVKNVAVSIAVPIAGYIGSMIFMTIISFRGTAKWLAYTPLPYMQLSAYFTQDSSVTPGMSIGGSLPVNLTYGIILLVALSVLCMVISSVVFNKRDIVN
jgi:ABC-2 type transport system permease protein